MMAVNTVRKLAILGVLASLALSASAFTVGIAPAEDEAYAKPPEGLGSPIDDLVSGCLGALFNAGHIATDASVARVSRADWGPAEYGLAAARDGMVDYLIALFVDWAPSDYNKSVLRAVTVDYRLVRILDGKVLAQGSVNGPPDSENASAHEARTASQAGALAIEPCLKNLSTLAMGGE